MRDRKMYFLDLQTLLTYLRGQSCELTTELNVSEKAARGSIFLKEGKIVHCLLNLHNGLQITGEQAYKQLETSTQWQVELEQPEEKKKNSPPAQFSPQLAPTPFLSTPSASPPLKQKRPLDPAFLVDALFVTRQAAGSIAEQIQVNCQSRQWRHLPLTKTPLDPVIVEVNKMGGRTPCL